MTGKQWGRIILSAGLMIQKCGVEALLLHKPDLFLHRCASCQLISLELHVTMSNICNISFRICWHWLWKAIVGSNQVRYLPTSPEDTRVQTCIAGKYVLIWNPWNKHSVVEHWSHASYYFLTIWIVSSPDWLFFLKRLFFLVCFLFCIVGT